MPWKKGKSGTHLVGNAATLSVMGRRARIKRYLTMEFRNQGPRPAGFWLEEFHWFSGLRAGSFEGSTSLAHSLRFQLGTGVSHPCSGTKRERSTNCIRWM